MKSMPKALMMWSRILLVLAVIDLTVMVGLHIAALGGWRSHSALPKVLDEALITAFFIPFIFSIFAMNRMTQDFKQKELWRAALRGCPKWMRPIPQIAMGYAFFVAFILSFVYGGGPDAPRNFNLVGSAWLLPLGAISVCVLYSATRVNSVDEARHCLKGHRISPLANYCEDCGAPAAPESV